MEESMNKQFTLTIVGLFLLAVLFAPRANAADTSDVIAGVILGGIIGNEIGKSDRRYREPLYMEFPYGSIIVNRPPHRRSYDCHFEVDQDGYPISATPTCVLRGDRWYRGSSRVVPYDIKRKQEWPCGGYWGHGCRRLIQQLKDGTIRGQFDFTH